MTKTFYGDLCMEFFGTLYHEFLWDFVDFLKSLRFVRLSLKVYKIYMDFMD